MIGEFDPELFFKRQHYADSGVRCQSCGAEFRVASHRLYGPLQATMLLENLPNSGFLIVGSHNDLSTSDFGLPP